MNQPPAGVRQAVITRREARWLGVIFIWFLLIAGAATFPHAVILMPPLEGNVRSEIDLRDDAAPARWPARTPHAEPWPPPRIWRQTTELGYDYYWVRGPGLREGGNDFTMEIWRAGFPLRIIEAKQMWWDWEDASLRGPNRDLALTLRWPGLLLNPLLLAGLAFALFIVPVVAFILGRRLARRTAGRCVFCGYPIGESPVCTECGRDLGGAGTPKTATPAV